MTGIVALLAGCLVVAGAVAVAGGLRRTWQPRLRRNSEPLTAAWSRLTRRPSGPRGRGRDLLLLGSAAVGLLVTALTGWVLALVLVPLVVLGLPPLLALPRQRDADVMEALERWVRSLAATLSTGRSITDAIRVSRRTPPPLLAEPLGLLVARLNSRWETADALRRFADDLDSPDADAVLAALIMADSRGANGATATLQALADSLQDQLKVRRMIEAERAKPYVVVRQVTMITIGALLLVVITNPGFFSAYTTPLGQVVLAVLVALYVASLAMLHHKARQRPRERILVRRLT